MEHESNHRAPHGTSRPGGGDLIDAPFELAGVHPIYRGLARPELVARLQVELMTADHERVDAVSQILGGGALAVRQAS